MSISGASFGYIYMQTQVLTAQQKLDKASIHLLMNHRFWGILLCSLNTYILEDGDPRNPYNTAAVDGKNLYFAKSLLNSCKIEEVIGILVHEICHIAFGHLIRLKDRYNFQLWNEATDYESNTNVILPLTKQDNAKIALVENCLVDTKYDNKYAEQILRMLEQEVNDQNEKNNSNNDNDGDDENNEGSSTDNKNSNCPKDHNGKRSFTDYHHSISEEQAKEHLETMVRIVNQLTDKEAGDLPSCISRRISDYLRPKIDFRKFIRASVTDLMSRQDYSYEKQSYLYQEIDPDMFMPKLTGKKNKTICVVFDTSGSISNDDTEMFVAETKGLLLLANTVLYMSCDAAVHELVELNEYDNILKKIKVKGGGGTSFAPPFIELEKKRIQPDIMIYLTDGYGGHYNKRPPYPVIFVRTKGAADKSTFPVWSTVVDLID